MAIGNAGFIPILITSINSQITDHTSHKDNTGPEWPRVKAAAGFKGALQKARAEIQI
jgi:hypothetical protein